MNELYIDEPAKWKTEKIAPNTVPTYLQLIQSVWAEIRASTLYSSVVYRHDFLSIPTGSAVCFWRNILVFHFAGLSMYNLFTYGLTR